MYQGILVTQRLIDSLQWAIFRGNRVIIPKVLGPEMLTRIHTSHLGAETRLSKARDVIYWPTMNSEVKDFISNCFACNDYLETTEKNQ